MGLLDKLKTKANASNASSSSSPAFPPGPAPIPLEQALVRYRKQRGLNFGSWFTTEDWLATQLYQTAAEPKRSDYDLARGANAKAAMEHHWDTWVSDADWNWIKQRGFNTVRLPIAYYHLVGGLPDILKGTEFENFASVYQGAWQRILAAIDRAGREGLGVLIDLHAAPGAQNTDAHSGLSTGKVNFWSKRSNLAQTSVALRFLASTFASNPTVVGLELLNEPANNDKLMGWYESMLNEIRPIAGPDFPIYVSDAWDTAWYSKWVGGRTDFVVLDHHLYRCFDACDRAMPGRQHADKLRHEFCHQFGEWCRQANGALVVGEWSAGLDDSCLPQGTPDGEKDAQKREWVAAQLEMYDNSAAGYYFWTLKTDRPWDAGWSALNAGQAKILPASLVRKRFQSPPPQARDSACEQGCNAHCGYWSQHGGNPSPEIFNLAFKQGWDDQLMFLSSPGQHELGFVQQWSRRRKAETETRNGPMGGAGWQWDHGFEQGVKTCSAAALC